MSLTGNTRFRESIFHKIVLEVEVIEPAPDTSFGTDPYAWMDTCTYWRDAKESDLKELGWVLG